MKKSTLIYVAVALLAAMGGFLISKTWLQPLESAKTIETPSASASPGQTAAAPPAERSIPETLPEFSLQNRDGQLQSVHSWPDKSLILNFWATWCAPCRREIPLLKELQAKHGSEGFQVVGVAVDFREDVLKYAEQMKMDYPLLIGEQDGLKAVDAFGIATVGFPFTVFTDKQGRIVITHIGELKADEAAEILSAVNKVNRGELTPAQARAEVAGKRLAATA